jgi:antitoxin VapB
MFEIYPGDRMAFSLKDSETDSLADRVASLTEETLTEAVRGALRLRLRAEQLKGGKAPGDDAAIDAIIARFAALPVLDDRTDDEILGYDQNGRPA